MPKFLFCGKNAITTRYSQIFNIVLLSRLTDRIIQTKVFAREQVGKQIPFLGCHFQLALDSFMKKNKKIQ